LEHVLALYEAHFEVELGEFGLAVGAEVFVAEAACYLEVAPDAGDHEELLELLGRLGQGVELAGVHAAGHQVVSRSLRGALDEDGGLDLEEVAGVQVIADELDEAVAQDR